MHWLFFSISFIAAIVAAKLYFKNGWIQLFLRLGNFKAPQKPKIPPHINLSTINEIALSTCQKIEPVFTCDKAS